MLPASPVTAIRTYKKANAFTVPPEKQLTATTTDRAEIRIPIIGTLFGGKAHDGGYQECNEKHKVGGGIGIIESRLHADLLPCDRMVHKILALKAHKLGYKAYQSSNGRSGNKSIGKIFARACRIHSFHLPT